MILSVNIGIKSHLFFFLGRDGIMIRTCILLNDYNKYMPVNWEMIEINLLNLSYPFSDWKYKQMNIVSVCI